MECGVYTQISVFETESNVAQADRIWQQGKEDAEARV